MKVMLWQALFAIGLSLCLCSCSDPSPEQTVSRNIGQLTGAGATFPEPLYQQWLKQYQALHPDLTIHYQGLGSGAGVNRFIAEQVDFAASDAALSDKEKAQVARGALLLPMTAGMVVLAYNLPDVKTGLKLPREVYAEIYLGKKLKWDDPRILSANPGIMLPAISIQPVVRRDGSGTTFAFTNHLQAFSQLWQQSGLGVAKLLDWPAALTGKGNEGIAQKVKITQGAIGYMEYGFARRLGLSVATIENRAGHYILPNAEGGRSALASAVADMPDDLRLFLPDPPGDKDYPIVSLSWILLYKQYPDPTTSEALKKLFLWCLADGQQVAEEMDYIPLPEPILTAAKQALE